LRKLLFLPNFPLSQVTVALVRKLPKSANPRQIFCRIIKNEIPSFKVFENESVLAFLDVNPLSRGHTLVIPKAHAQKLHELPDTAMTELLPVVKRVALALDSNLDYNILQNNGRNAYQSVDHVHFHVIPKVPANPSMKPVGSGQIVPEQLVNKDMQGLGLNWKVLQIDKDDMAKLAAELRAKVEASYAAEKL